MKKVYVVMGSTGEYSDHQEWMVAAYFNEALAAKRVVDCDRAASARFVDRFKNCDPDPLDPEMRLDYTGTKYSVYALDIVDSEIE